MSEPPSNAWEPWFKGKQFTSDWATDRFAVWTSVLGDLADQHVDILEIGSWEGRSAIFFLEYLPHSRITCIDTFEGSPLLRSIPKWNAAIPYAQHRFDLNLLPYGDRVEKICSHSIPALFALFRAARCFDLIYIDGSHERDDVLMDSILSWRLLNENGILIWDDYTFQSARPPKPAIDIFLAMNADDLTEIHRGKQLIVRKHASARSADGV